MIDTAPTLDADASAHTPATGWAHGRVGVWLVGARGSVATAVAVGLHALATGLAAPTGCTTAGAEFAGVPLPGFGDLVLGGHDVSSTPLAHRAQALADSGMIPQRYVTAALAGLEQADAEIRPGYHLATHSGTQADAVARLAGDITAFRDRHGLDHVVVVDISSTEPIAADRPEFHDAALPRCRAGRPGPGRAAVELDRRARRDRVGQRLRRGSRPRPGSRCPSCASWPRGGASRSPGRTARPARRSSARRSPPCSCARDARELLGGGEPARRRRRRHPRRPEAVQSKLASKTRGLRSLVGEHVVAPLHIDNVPDLGDIKTAWDHIHAEGFLGSRITMQTIWSAYDSMLAAPLVLDLARLLALADAADAGGVVPELGFFFKDPWGSDVHDFGQQTTELIEWAHRPALASPLHRGPHGWPGDHGRRRPRTGARARRAHGRRRRDGRRLRRRRASRRPAMAAAARLGVPLQRRHGPERLRGPSARRGRAAGAADPVGARRPAARPRHRRRVPGRRPRTRRDRRRPQGRSRWPCRSSVRSCRTTRSSRTTAAGPISMAACRGLDVMMGARGGQGRPCPPRPCSRCTRRASPPSPVARCTAARPASRSPASP